MKSDQDGEESRIQGPVELTEEVQKELKGNMIADKNLKREVTLVLVLVQDSLPEKPSVISRRAYNLSSN